MIPRGVQRLARAAALLRWREFALAPLRCPYCGPSALVRLRRDEIGIRCVRCGASSVHLAIGAALRELVGALSGTDACELSARGPLARHLRRHARSVALSEFFADVAVGSARAGVRCEDVQRLSYPDASFDLVTHTEVMEHVPDDALAYAELRRVLRPGGLMLFTVPLHGAIETVERAYRRDGAIEHRLVPAYHGDPLHDGAQILVYRDYGRDILDRLTRAGFVDARLHTPQLKLPLTPLRPIVIARAPAPRAKGRDE